MSIDRRLNHRASMVSRRELWSGTAGICRQQVFSQRLQQRAATTEPTPSRNAFWKKERDDTKLVASLMNVGWKSLALGVLIEASLSSSPARHPRSLPQARTQGACMFVYFRENVLLRVRPQHNDIIQFSQQPWIHQSATMTMRTSKA
jgi:hypothetical protein